MIIEIGTSDFRTLAGIRKGIFIEPVKEHFDRLPECNKLNVAVSNYEGYVDVYYIPLKIIKEKGLPNWLRGCNSIGSMHPTVISTGNAKYCVNHSIEVVRIKSIIESNNVKDIELLKIDTEGHDTVILNDYLDTVDIKPKKIQFENNSLSDQKEVLKVCSRLHKLGYKTKQVKFDMIAEL